MKLKKQMILAAALIFIMVFLIGCGKSEKIPEPLAIETQPVNAVVSAGEGVELSVVVAGKNSAKLSYQWFQTKDAVNRNSDDIQKIGNEGEFISPSNTDGREISGAAASVYTPPTDSPGVNSYYVEISNGTEVVVSNAVTVAVKSPDMAKDSSDAINIVFICGGNTGRSPMAQVIAQEVFAQKGIPAIITSAGSDIIDGDRAEANAVTLMAERGLDLSSHIAQWWTPEMLQSADYVFVMAESHKNRVNVPTLGIYADKVFLLREFVGDSGSVPDPFEEPMEAYIETADIITDAINKLAEQLAQKS